MKKKMTDIRCEMTDEQKITDMGCQMTDKKFINITDIRHLFLKRRSNGPAFR